MLFLDACVADKIDFKNLFLYSCLKIIIFSKIKKWRPTKRAPWPTGGRGVIWVEKHWSRLVGRPHLDVSFSRKKINFRAFIVPKDFKLFKMSFTIDNNNKYC